VLRILSLKLKESLTSVLPVTAIVLLLNLTPLVQLTGQEVLVFSISALVLILGMALFNLGADMAMTPMGEQVGSGLSRARSVGLLLAVCFIMGVFITVAEPDLSVLATQVAEVMNGTLMIVTVGVGVGLFLVLLGYIGYFQVKKSQDIIRSPYNARQNSNAKRVTRGTIVDKNGNVLAKTDTAADGSETREYPYGNAFAHVVGYNVQGKSGIESLENYDLLTSDENFLIKLKNEFQDKKNSNSKFYT